MRFALLLLQDLCASLAKVGQVHETNGLRLEHLLRGGALAREGPGCGSLAVLFGCHIEHWISFG
jgi:hypothetical protein